MKFRKMTALIVTVFLLVVCAFPVAADESSVKVYVNETVFEAGKAKIVNGLTYVPLRAFCDAMGECEIIWDPETGTATINAEGLIITATKGYEYICANGRYLFSASPNYIGDDNRLYVPIRPIAKAYGAEVTWDENNCAAIVGLPTEPIENADAFYDKDDLYWLSRIISAESCGEPLIGQIAVGNVVLNRMDIPGYPQTVYGIVFDTRYGVQFTPTVNGTIYAEPYDSSVIAAKICLEGFSLSKDMVFFLNPDTASNLWTVYNCTHVMTIANHAFYAY